MQSFLDWLMFSFILVLGLFILIFVASGVKILKEWERVAILRLGKFLRISGPGIIWVTPIFDKIGAKLSLREEQTIVDTGKFVSGDGSASRLAGFVNWRIIDAERAVLAVEDYRNSVETAIGHQIEKVGESFSSDAIYSDLEQVYSSIIQELEPLLDKWGIKITKIELKAEPHWEQ